MSETKHWVFSNIDLFPLKNAQKPKSLWNFLSNQVFNSKFIHFSLYNQLQLILV